jgi:hypothetical protein
LPASAMTTRPRRPAHRAVDFDLSHCFNSLSGLPRCVRSGWSIRR